jgi:hypothetical protein
VKPVAAALTIVDDRYVRMTSLSRTWLASAIDAAISAVDADGRIPDTVTARLLSAPAYRVQAFWFRDGDQDWVYVISTSPTAKAIHPGDWMPARTFVEALGREEYVRGVERARR